MKHIFDTKEKSDPRNTSRFLLSYGKLSGFRVSGKAWTLSGTVSVDSPTNCRGMTALRTPGIIAKRGFVEAEGASERPNAIEYLSVHCNLSQLILGSPSEAQNVLYADFSKISANTTWNSLWERGLPDFAWRPVRGGLCV